MHLARAFRLMSQRALDLKGMRRAGSTVVARWQRLGLWRSLMEWSETAAGQQRMVRAADCMARRWRNIGIVPAMSTWRCYVDERRRLRRVAGKVICRMENMRLWAAFGGLVESVSMARISQERLSIRSARLEDVTEAVQRWQHQPVARAWERLHAYHTMCMRLKQLIHRMQSLRRVKALVRWDE